MSTDSRSHNDSSTWPLEAVQLEMLLDIADLISRGFETVLAEVVEDIGGRILFNRRLEDDPHHQRVAAVTVGPRADAVLVFLDHAGTAVHVEPAAASGHAAAREALALTRRESSRRV